MNDIFAGRPDEWLDAVILVNGFARKLLADREQIAQLHRVGKPLNIPPLIRGRARIGVRARACIRRRSTGPTGPPRPAGSLRRHAMGESHSNNEAQCQDQLAEHRL
jgi:hypothetical protein